MGSWCGVRCADALTASTVAALAVAATVDARTAHRTGAALLQPGANTVVVVAVLAGQSPGLLLHLELVLAYSALWQLVGRILGCWHRLQRQLINHLVRDALVCIAVGISNVESSGSDD